MSNLSQLKREILDDFLDRIMTRIGDSEEDRILLAEVKKEIDSRRYGLIWEEHSERVDEQLEMNVPVFREDKERRITADDQAPYNFLLEGDNLHSLYLLEKTYHGKIDVIYIDPPYNTGKKDFRYDDSFVDKDDAFIHSKWLSFMKRRLTLAKELLSDKGVIFISIDDREQAPLKLLCDEIFGQDNFVANAIWEKKYSPQNDAKWLSDNHDFVVIYARNKETWKPNLLSRTADMNARYKNPDNDPRGDWKAGDLSVKTYNAANDYPITTPGGKVVTPPAGRCWSVSEERFKELVADNRIWFGKKGTNVPSLKQFLSEVQQGSVCKTLWYRTEVGDNQEGVRDLKACMDGQGVFTSPKPVRLIERCLQLASGKDSVILDFFAGSGTTGHAVMRQNKTDGGNRRYILCTNNENNICEDVTYRRLANIQSEFPHNLKYFKTDYISREDPDLYELLQDNVICMIELENACDAESDQIEIIFTDDQLVSFMKSEKKQRCRLLYVSSMVFIAEELRRDIEAASTKIIEIPECYFGTELYELGM